MKVSELRQKTTEELLELIKTWQKDIEKVSLDILQGKEKNIRRPRFIRKDVARAKTILKEQQNAEEKI
jgi:ribosomal protein L29